MRIVVLITAIMLSITTVAAVEEYDGPENKPHIMSPGSSASSTTAVSPNGTEYRTNVEMTGRNPNVTEGSVSNIVYNDGVTEFEGRIRAPTPCHTLAHEVEKTGKGTYSLNLKTVNQNSEGFCTQQAVMIEYNASFERNSTDYTVTVSHDGKELRKLNHPEIHSDEPSSPITGFINWLQTLF